MEIYSFRDDDFSVIKDKINKKIDVIYIDTLHEADHVEKIIWGIMIF